MYKAHTTSNSVADTDGFIAFQLPLPAAINTELLSAQRIAGSDPKLPDPGTQEDAYALSTIGASLANE